WVMAAIGGIGSFSVVVSGNRSERTNVRPVPSSVTRSAIRSLRGLAAVGATHEHSTSASFGVYVTKSGSGGGSGSGSWMAQLPSHHHSYWKIRDDPPASRYQTTCVSFAWLRVLTYPHGCGGSAGL